MPGQLHCKYFEKNFCKLFAYTAPKASSKWNEAEPGCILWVRQQKAVRIEFLLVGEDISDIMSIADTVDYIPAFGNLVSLQKIMISKGLTNWNSAVNREEKKSNTYILGRVMNWKKRKKERWREKKTDIQGQGNVIKRNLSQSRGNKGRFKTTTQKVGVGERELLTYI